MVLLETNHCQLRPVSGDMGSKKVVASAVMIQAATRLLARTVADWLYYLKIPKVCQNG